MRVELLSDAHVDALDDPVQERLVAFLDASRADRLILLGDVFHRWWGLGPGVFPAYVPLCAALLRARKRGIELDFVRGNHDFAMGPAQAAALGMRVHDRLVLDADGVRVCCCHGDQAVTARRYRAYHRILRGSAFDLALRVAGPERAWGLLGRLAGSPEKEGRCPEALLVRQRALARHLLAEGADLVVMGHSHVPEEHRFPEGRYVNAGSFRDPGTWVSIEGGEARVEGA